ncbi:hypothetical protein SDC9_62730 [bioreactor metagenome]|uniref:Uncharacterized protein n=1 Tax=bioreactor metagenome TaxID=1076179 RepID=A0A644XJI5_9ZZZZ
MRGVLHCISKAVLTEEVAVRRVKNLAFLQLGGSVGAVFTAQKRNGFHRGIDVYIRIVRQNVDIHVSVLSASRFVRERGRCVVDVGDRYKNVRRVGSAVAVGNGIAERVLAYIVFVRRVFDLPKHDQRRAVGRLGYGVDGQRVAVRKVGVVCQNIDREMRILFQRDIGIVRCNRRVVDRVDRKVELVARCFTVGIGHGYGNHRRASVLFSRRGYLQACAAFALDDFDRAD